MWNPGEKAIRKERILAMTPVRPGNGPDTVRAGAGALSFIIGARHAKVSEAFHGCVEPTALVIVEGPLRAESTELLNLRATPVDHASDPPITVHIGCVKRLESSATSGPQHVIRTIALAAAENGTMSVTVEPGWEQILWDGQ